ncbi:MAG: cytochrome c biogenesis protein CcsA [Chloroflexota bacterium]
MTTNVRWTGWHLTGFTLNFLTMLSMIAIMWAALLYAKPAANLAGVEQIAQRIFYVHLGCWFATLAGYIMSIVGSVAYLFSRYLNWDRVTQSSIELGALFATAGTITGAIWAKPTWNTYWTWDPRLTTTTITVLIYVAYLLFRNGIENRRTRALFGTIYALVASFSLPLTYYSARWFRSIHPIIWDGANEEAQGSFEIGVTMGHTLTITMIGFCLLYSALMIQRMRQLRMEDSVAELREELE